MPEGLLAPKLYRAAFAPALLALVVLAFSLQQPSPAAAPELSPPGFSPARAETFARQAVSAYGARQSGSQEDDRLAQLVEARLQGVGFRTTNEDFATTTLAGRRTLSNVVAIRSGPSDRRLLVIASRDGSPGELREAGALETGILLELARALEGRGFEHTLVLASVSGGIDGGLGAARLARDLRGPFDAVLVVRNVRSVLSDSPVLASSDSRSRPDERFVRTVRLISGLEFGRALKDQRRSVPAQLVRLGFPLSLGEQAGLIDEGLGAVSLSPGGEPLAVQGPNARAQVGAVGQIALRTLTTADRSFAATPPSSTPLLVGGKFIPQWALVLLIGTLLFPLVVASVDAWARARRRHEVSQRGLLAPAIALVWLLVIGFLLRGAGLSGIIDAPQLAPDPAAVRGFAAPTIGVFALLLGLLGVMVAAGAARQATPKGGESAFAMWIVFTGLAVFAVNPVAAGFLLLLLHLVVLMLLTTPPRRGQVVGLTLAGLVPLLLAAAYYSVALAIPLPAAPRYVTLLVAGGFVSPLALAAACASFAALGTAIIHLWWSAPRQGLNQVSRPVIRGN